MRRRLLIPHTTEVRAYASNTDGAAQQQSAAVLYAAQNERHFDALLRYADEYRIRIFTGDGGRALRLFIMML